MRYQIYISVMLIVTIFGCAQKKKYPYKISDFRFEIQKHIQKIILEEELLYNPDTLVLNFLKDSCTREELIMLLKFENPLVRVRAYSAIISRNEPDYFSILLDHLDDTAKVTLWYYDDVADKFTVSDLLIRECKFNWKLTPDQNKTLIDSVLLKHSYLGASNWMMQDIKPNEKYYLLIKQRAKIKTDRCGIQLGACYALSKFKKEEDIEFLYNIFNDLEGPCEDWIFKAIEENPIETYYSILEKYMSDNVQKQKQFLSDDLKFFCRAIAQYKSPKSLNILIALTKKETYPNSWYLSYNKEYVFKAIHKYKAPIYDSLYNALRLQMNESVIDYLDIISYDEVPIW